MLMDGRLKSHVQSESSFATMCDALHTYTSNMSDGKVLLVPSKA